MTKHDSGKNGTGEGKPFELTPEQATDIPPAAGWFDRKKVMVTVCASLAAIVCVAMVLNINSAPGGTEARDGAENPAVVPTGFIGGLRDRAVVQRIQYAGTLDALPPEEAPEEAPEPFPSVAFVREPPAPPPPPPQPPPPRPSPPPAGVQAPPGPAPVARRTGLVPERIEGSLFRGGTSASGPPVNTGNPFGGTSVTAAPPPGIARNGLDTGPAFFDSAGGGAMSGGFLEDGTVWIGTMIPGVLITAINTDLPGHVLARVSRNVYDSRTGWTLLIPQGTVMVARYDSSVSFAQRRVRIVWDALIRPDGFMVDLGGMGGVDAEGMSGQAARYHGNWFEYVRAASVVTVLAMAGSTMAETAARYSDSAAAAAAESGTETVNRVGGNMIDRVTDVQPTLTVASGTHVNIMVNRTIRLPPVAYLPVTERFVRR